MEVILDAIRTTLESFDFAYCIAVNVLTYLLIKYITAARKGDVGVWRKRAVLLACILAVGAVYYIGGASIKLLLNSSILAPVFWSWVLKPLCARFNVDYKDIAVD